MTPIGRMDIYYGRDGRRMSKDRWSVLIEDPEYKRVAFDQVGDVEISTIWMGRALPGMDTHDVFDSWVSAPGVTSWNQFYATEDAAKRGHAELVARTKAEYIGSVGNDG